MCGSHYDNAAQFASKSDLVPHNPRICTKVSLPKVMAKGDGVGSAGAIFVISKTAAQEKLYAESAEKLRTDPHGMKPLWLSRVGEVDTGRSEAISGNDIESAVMVGPRQNL